MQAAVPRLDTVIPSETPEGVALTLRPAGVVARSLAWVIDFGLRLLLFGVAVLVARNTGKVGGGLLLLMYFAIEWLYPVACELSREAATPGKRALGLRVLMDSGLPITPAASFTRNLLRAADFLPLLYGSGLLCMLLRTDGKRLGDLAAGTLVVYGDQVGLDAQLPPATPQPPAQPLDPRQQRAIVACAGRARRLTDERFEELAQWAAPVLGAEAGAPAGPRLLAVARWELGHREGEAR